MVIKKVNQARVEFWFVLLLNFYDVLNKTTLKCKTFKTWNLESEEKLLRDFFFLCDFLCPEERLMIWRDLNLSKQNWVDSHNNFCELRQYQFEQYSSLLNNEDSLKQNQILFSQDLLKIFSCINVTSGLSALHLCLGNIFSTII
jgi:hypothetical protein